MQYANIIIEPKAGGKCFTYAIPPSLLGHMTVGSIVTIPIGRQVVFGVVQQFVRRIDPAVARKLKPITAVNYRGPFVPDYLLQAARKLHHHYGYSEGDCLFSLLPPLLKRGGETENAPMKPGTNQKVSHITASLLQRSDLYTRLFRRQAEMQSSLLIICANATTAANLAEQITEPTVLYPATQGDKAIREYARDAGGSSPKIYIGTRGALKTPLHTMGAIVIDEPWLPGHKEENAPRLWSSFVAQSLARERGIPLYLVSCLAWPEDKLLTPTRSLKLRTSPLGSVHFVPTKPLREILTSFLAAYELEDRLAVVLREIPQDRWWCPSCRLFIIPTQPCRHDPNRHHHFPPLTKATLTQTLQELALDYQWTIHTLDEAVNYQKYDAMLTLNMDALLAIVDFRADMYWRTILTLLRQQTNHLHLVTQQSEVWAACLTLTDQEQQALLSDRQHHGLPPYRLAVQVSAPSRSLLELPDIPPTATLGPVRRYKDQYRRSLLVPRSFLIPEAWHHRRKVDILPLYIDPSP